MHQINLDMLRYLQSDNWDYMLTVTFKGEFDYRSDLLDYRLAALDGLMCHINCKLVNKRWYVFNNQDYVTGFGVMEWGRYRVNPHYHILLDVPNLQKQTYDALNQTINSAKFVLSFETLHLAKRSESNQLANYLLKENHWQNGHIYAFSANNHNVKLKIF